MTDETQGKLDFSQAEQKQVEDKPLPTDLQRVASTLLIEAALIYRDMFVPQDLKDLKTLPVPKPDTLRTNGTKQLTVKGATKMHHERVSALIHSMTGLSERLRREVALQHSRTDKGGSDWITQHAQFIARAMQQIIPAKDKQELYSLMMMYNAGELDFLFEKYRQEKAQKDTADATTDTIPAEQDIPG